MKIKVTTKVNASLSDVKSGFNESLFKALSPPFPKVELSRFDGSKTGDIVSLKLNFGFFKQVWTSEIIQDSTSEENWQFIDKGIELPFFLKSWNHQHVVEARNRHSLIIDDINYTTGTIVTDILFYPLLLGQFLYRKPIYKKVFHKKGA